jgi:hypothetical protein
MKQKTTEKQQIDILKINFGRLHFNVLGDTPLVINRLAEKARHELLLPALKKNRAGRETTLKHNPREEFVSSLYRTRLDSSPTRLYFPGSAFASLIADTALDIPGASRAQLERLVKVADINIAVYGIPKLFMAPVRTAGMNKTPDIRTRAILPEWACPVTVTFVRGLITERSVTNLLAAGGVIGGIGDGRGKMGFGQFSLVPAGNKEFARIMKMGRVHQDKAIEAAETYDDDSRELYEWFENELILREKGQDDAPLIPRATNNEELEEELV